MIVLTLGKQLLDQGYMDNWYSSPALFRQLYVSVTRTLWKRFGCLEAECHQI